MVEDKTYSNKPFLFMTISSREGTDHEPIQQCIYIYCRQVQRSVPFRELIVINKKGEGEGSILIVYGETVIWLIFYQSIK